MRRALHIQTQATFLFFRSVTLVALLREHRAHLSFKELDLLGCRRGESRNRGKAEQCEDQRLKSHSSSANLTLCRLAAWGFLAGCFSDEFADFANYPTVVRPEIALLRVSSSACSSPPPAGSPCASRVNFTPCLRKSAAR